MLAGFDDVRCSVTMLPPLTAARVGNPMRSPDGHRHEVAQGGVSGI